MSAVLAGRGDLRQKRARALQAHGIDVGQVLVARRGPAIERRLDVYAAGYALRLVACLAEEFPALCAFWGRSMFETFARAYILDHPPATRSLFDLGRAFPDYLEQTRPPLMHVAAEQRDALVLPAQIARLERATSEVTRAPGLEGLGLTLLPSPLGLLSAATRVEVAPCLLVLELDYPLIDFCAALERGESASLPGREPSWVAVTRVHWQVSRWPLQPWQAIFLRWCQAERRAVALHEGPSAPGGAGASEMLARLWLWLPAAVDAGLLRLVAASDRGA
jgi:hypothetical protein